MKNMVYVILGTLAFLLVASVIIGCRSCRISGNGSEVPDDIANCRLMSYSYTLHNTSRWPLHSERVERCKDDSTRCVIRIFDPSCVNNTSDLDEETLGDTIVASAEVLDHIKQMLIEAQAWRFKDYYMPRVEILDGWSWGFTAEFELSEDVLNATSENERPRLIRRGGRRLQSGGSNAKPDTDLFEKVRTYLLEVMNQNR